MHIDVVQLHIVIALGVVGLAARVADRERRPGGSSPVRVSLVRLLVPARGKHEMQSTTGSRSISITCLVTLVLAAGMTVGCARSPGVLSGAAGDGWLVKPAAEGWAKICPEVARDGAARNGYLQRHRTAIALAARERDQEWAWMEQPAAVEPPPQTASSGNRESHT